MKLKKVISGGQTGADQAGLVVAKRFGLETGGWMPKGFKTQEGSRPQFANIYTLQEHISADYSPRTELNVKESCGTVRLAACFDSRGEICTLKYIKKHKKPYIDIDLADKPTPRVLAEWILENQIEVLNVAGNSENTYAGAFSSSASYLQSCFFELGLAITISAKEFLANIKITDTDLGIFDSNNQAIHQIAIKKIVGK